MPRAAIDVGSNSFLLTVLSDDGSLLHDEARVVGLGRGLGDRGLLLPERMKAAESTLSDYLEVAAEHGIDPWQVRAVGTSACRRAMNAETWVSRVQRAMGLKIRIVTGEEEAHLTWLGAHRDLELAPGPRLVIDLGGGSTELVLGIGDRMLERTSLEMGSVRITEEFLGTGLIEPMDVVRTRTMVEHQVQRFRFDPSPDAVIGVAGTVTTLAAMTLGLQTYDPNSVHGFTLTRDHLAQIKQRLLPATPAERRDMVPSAPDRADYLLAGAVIIDEVLRAAGVEALTVSDRGLRYGLLSF